MAIATSCTRLRVLRTYSSGEGDALTDAVLAAVASNCGETLQELECGEQKRITAEGLEQFKKQLPRVNVDR